MLLPTRLRRHVLRAIDTFTAASAIGGRFDGVVQSQGHIDGDELEITRHLMT